MPRYLQYLFGVAIATLLVAGPVVYKHCWDGYIRNLRQVCDGRLKTNASGQTAWDPQLKVYRSGQLSLNGLRRVIHDYGIKTVISLRDGVREGDPPPDLQEENYCLGQDINYCRISPRSWWSPDGSVPAEEGVREFRAVMDNDDNYPVLIHCLAGIHRTGAFTAIYRMEYEHWGNEAALAEMRACGYSNLADEWDILGFLDHYHPRWQQEDKPSTAVTIHPATKVARQKKHRAKKPVDEAAEGGGQ